MSRVRKTPTEEKPTPGCSAAILDLYSLQQLHIYQNPCPLGKKKDKILHTKAEWVWFWNTSFKARVTEVKWWWWFSVTSARCRFWVPLVARVSISFSHHQPDIQAFPASLPYPFKWWQQPKLRLCPTAHLLLWHKNRSRAREALLWAYLPHCLCCRGDSPE